MKKILLILLTIILLIIPVATSAEAEGQVTPSSKIALAGRDWFAASMAILKNVKDDQGVWDVLFQVFDHYPAIASPSDKAIIAAMALDLTHTLKDPMNKSNALDLVAKFAAENACLDKPGIVAELAILKNVETNADIFGQIVNIYNHLGDKDKALSLLDKFAGKYLAQPKDKMDYTVLNQIVSSYSSLGKFEQAYSIAVQNYHRTQMSNALAEIIPGAIKAKNPEAIIKIIKQFDNSDDQDWGWANVAFCYAGLNDLKKVNEYSQKIKNTQLKEYLFSNIGQYYQPNFDYQRIVKNASELTWPQSFLSIASFVPNYYKSGLQEEAKQLLLEARKLAENKNQLSDFLVAEVIARDYVVIGDRESAIKMLEQVTPTFTGEINATMGNFEAIFEQYFHTEEYKVASLLVSRYVEWARKIPSETTRYNVLMKLIDWYTFSQDKSKARGLYQEALELAKKLNQPLRLFDTYIEGCELYRDAQSTRKEILMHAVELFKTTKDSHMFITLNNACAEQGERDLWNQVMKLAPQQDLYAQVRSLVKLAKGSTDNGNPKQALEVLQSALKLTGLQKNDKEEINRELARTYFYLGDNAKLIQTLQLVSDDIKWQIITNFQELDQWNSKEIKQSLDLVKVIKDPKYIDKALSELGFQAAYIGDYALCFEILKRVSNPVVVATALTNIVDNYGKGGVGVNPVIEKGLTELVQKFAQSKQ